MVSQVLKKELFINNSPTKKLIYTLVVILIYKILNSIPLTGIDQEALKRAFLESDNKGIFLQYLNIYSGSGSSKYLLTAGSFGIIPYINAAIIVDLLTQIFPPLEKLQKEEGSLGVKQLNRYKKYLTIVVAIFQALGLIGFLQPYMYNTGQFYVLLLCVMLISGSFFTIYLSQVVDDKGIGNGQSLFILCNILATILGKNQLNAIQSRPGWEIGFLLFLSAAILLTQYARVTLRLISARQLSFNKESFNLSLENIDRQKIIKDNTGLVLKFAQAGIFPIIIASNLLPILSLITKNKIPEQISQPLYYALIVLFNYFYTTIFWDPEKISEELRKSSVAIEGVESGEKTKKYLENQVKATSLVGGLSLVAILIAYEFVKNQSKSPFLGQINISSLIIAIGISSEVAKTVQAVYKNARFELQR
jgi:preprotein translocase subunit SecY